MDSNLNKTQEQFERETCQRHIIKNAVTIVNTFDSGKMPIYLAEAGYKVIVAGSQEKLNLHSRFLETSQELDKNNSRKSVIYSSGLPVISNNYRIIFITYCSELIRKVLDNKNEKAVLIIEDSFNSIGANLLFGLFQKLLAENCSLKLVIINTIEKYNDKLCRFFNNAPIISSNSKTYPVSFYQTPKSIRTILLNKIYKGKTFLVLLPDADTIDDLIKKIQLHNIDAVLLKMTSSSASNDIVKNVNKKDGITKIIFSIKKHFLQNFTKLDIDILVDSGMEKRAHVINGSSILSLENISKFDIQQRKDFIGRYSPGTYYLCSTFDYDNRKEVKTEHTSALTNMLLTLLSFNIHTKTLKFLNSKIIYRLQEAYVFLKKLDAINYNGITDIGKKMEQIPLEVSFSRIIVEAEKYDVKFDAFICCLIQKCKKIIRENKEPINCDLESDLFTQLYWFKKLFVRDKEINWSIFDNSSRIMNIASNLGITPNNNAINTRLLKKCLAAGLPDSLFITNNRHGYRNHIWERSYLLANSSLNSEKCSYIVGFSRSLPNSKDGSLARILYPTSFTLEEVIECYSKHFKISYSISGNNIFEHQQYNGISIQVRFIGTVEELRNSTPEAFHEENEIDSGKPVKSLYFYDLKVKSIPYIKIV